MEKYMRSSKEITEAMHDSMWCKADEVTQLETTHAELLEALDEISNLHPGNIDMAYEIADQAVRNAEKQA